MDLVVAAHAAGTRPRMVRGSNNIVLVVAGRRRPVILVRPDGTVTPEGTRFYELEGVPPPTVYAYEQPLIHGKWVRNFSGGRTLVRRMGADGRWEVTPLGRAYFRSNRTTVTVWVPAVLARPRLRQGRLRRTYAYYRDMDEQRMIQLPVSVHVPALDREGNLRSDADIQAEGARKAMHWLMARPFLDFVTGDMTPGGDDLSQAMIEPDSDSYWVYDPTREVDVRTEQTNVHDPSGGSESVLEVPLRRIAVPDGCWRAYDLHPGSFENTGRCAVSMLHSSFTRCIRKRGPNGTRPRVHAPAMTMEEIEADMDIIYRQLGYVDGEFPFERSWRDDGCTSRMVLEFCKKHQLKCFIRHKSRQLLRYVPENATDGTPIVHFSVFSGHAYWYGRGCRANNSASQLSAAITVLGDEDALHAADDASDCDERQRAPGREVVSFVQREEVVPAFSEWKTFFDLQEAAHRDWAPLVVEKKDLSVRHEESGARKRSARVYFWTTDLRFAERWARDLHAERQDFDISVMYGQSPDLKTGLVLRVGPNIPTIVVRAVPSDFRELQAICEAAGQEFGSDEVLVYRGQSRVQIADRLRQLYMKPARRCSIDPAVVDRLYDQCRGNCEICGYAVERRQPGAITDFQVDHVTPLCEGGVDDVSNLQILCNDCHATKTVDERERYIHASPLESRMNRDLLEGFLAAPKPQQLVWGDGADNCLQVDAIRCRTYALTKNDVALPVYSVLDELIAYEPGVSADFYYIDAGDTLDTPSKMLPYTGPGWYWCENFSAVMQHGYSSRGKITQSDVRCCIRAHNHTAPNVLTEPLKQVEDLIIETLLDPSRRDALAIRDGEGERPYDLHAAQKYAKAAVLSMQGLWTQQHRYSWRCVNSTIPEDALGLVHVTRNNPDGTVCMMSRTETLSCTNMYPIGLVALNKEHLLLFQLTRMMRTSLGGAMQIHGMCVDCLYVKEDEEAKRRLRRQDPMLLEVELSDLVEHGKRPVIVEALGCRSADDALHDLLPLRHNDGTPMFRVERDRGDDGDDAPPAKKRRVTSMSLPWTTATHSLPIESPWWDDNRTTPAESDDNSEQGDVDERDEQQSQLRFKDFGWWMQNPPMRRVWRSLEEDEGVGRGADDTFQDDIVPLVVRNRGAFIVGRGGVGKSYIIDKLKAAFEAEGMDVHVIALTHTAVANVCSGDVTADTILHFLHRFTKKKKPMTIIVDECSQVPLSMQSALLQLKFMGHAIVQMGDPHGQFLPIPDQRHERALVRLDRSDLMHDMCNGLHITLRKFRRGTDMDHFNRVGSLYPDRRAPNFDLEDELHRLRGLYPKRGGKFHTSGPTLVLSHRKRVRVNKLNNERLRPQAEDGDTRFVRVTQDHLEVVRRTPNKPQDVWLHRGLVMQAVLPENDGNMKNGLRFVLLASRHSEDGSCYEYQFSPTEAFTFVANPGGEGPSFWLREDEVMTKLRLTFAVTYFSAQAATIREPLRLEDTGHHHFTVRHLIVGLGRAPDGRLVQVC